MSHCVLRNTQRLRCFNKTDLSNDSWSSTSLLGEVLIEVYSLTHFSTARQHSVRRRSPAAEERVRSSGG